MNVNTTKSMTEAIGRQARRFASPGTEVVTVTPAFGAESIESNFESYLAAVGIIDAVLKYEEPFDAVIQAGYGEHGREGLQEVLDVPVVDITEAAASTALYLGYKYSVVTTLEHCVSMIENRLKVAGLNTRCASVRATSTSVLGLESNPEQAVDSIVREAAAAVANDGAEVICLGCGGMADLEERVKQKLGGVPVIDGVAAAVQVAESLVKLQLKTSKIKAYARPRQKALVGFPLL